MLLRENKNHRVYFCPKCGIRFSGMYQDENGIVQYAIQVWREHKKECLP